MFFDEIQQLLKYVNERYPEPDKHWSSKRYLDRCSELWGCERAIQRCMDNLYEPPSDILYDFIIYLDMLASTTNHPGKKHKFDKARDAVMYLLDKIDVQEEGGRYNGH